MSNAPPLIITVAPNGARKTRADHPALPITPDELAEEAAQCLATGAAMIHLHVRDEEGKHSLDVERYKAAIAAIRRRVGDDLIVQVTSEAVGVYSAEQQMAMVRELRPEAVSLAIRELCPEAGSEEAAATFFAWLETVDTAPQYILYSPADVARFEALRERGVIPGECPFVLYVLGRYGGDADASVEQLPLMIAAGKRDVIWSACAFGATEERCMESALTLGGHCRVGFENNLQLSSGDIAPNNAALVTQLVECAMSQGRRVATPAEVRNLLAMA
ncbi:MAG: 3-keto-5-aminohexanoate cleavage protein [Proteobacteria bacterium]|nr:3-keto-5-aminohexanoate cleavage protein [Pseudomonadota bacterium]